MNQFVCLNERARSVVQGTTGNVVVQIFPTLFLIIVTEFAATISAGRRFHLDTTRVLTASVRESWKDDFKVLPSQELLIHCSFRHFFDRILKRK